MKRRARRSLNNMFDMWVGESPKMYMTGNAVVVMIRNVCMKRCSMNWGTSLNCSPYVPQGSAHR